MSNFNLEFPCETKVPFDFTRYPDGTENLTVDNHKILTLLNQKPNQVTVNWKFQHHGIDMFRLSLISDFLYNETHVLTSTYFNLKVDYLPHARADRVFPRFNANPLRAFLNNFENLVFDELFVSDIHNYDAADGDSWVPITNIIQPKGFLVIPDAVYVAPDRGAKARVKKNLELIDCPQIRANGFLMVDKVRDPESGDVIQQFPAGYEDKVKGKTCFIIDDICDGGRTFIGLGEQLKAAGASKVTLVVTHGIFSQGLEVFKGKIDYIWTENVIGNVTQEDILKFNQELLTC